MRKIMFIGCGGSGGKTLRYIMDQITADLKARTNGEIDSIPRRWQFVYVDAPIQQEDSGRGDLKTVTEYNRRNHVVGKYCSIGTPNSYKQLVAMISEKLYRESRNKAMPVNPCVDFASWVDTNNLGKISSTPLTEGAGQKRAIGRTLMLSKLDDVVSAIREAGNRFADTSADNDANYISARVTELKEDDANLDDQTAFIFVIGSMAGGSGSSVLLDVARAAKIAVPKSEVMVYGYAAEIFNAVSGGIQDSMIGNSLAMSSEIMAMQATSDAVANEIDERLYRALNEPNGEGRPFKLFFPIGLSQGKNMTVLNDNADPDSIYRRLGKGLARMILSVQAFNQFTRYTLGNIDANGIPFNQDLFGWGPEPAAMGWASFGYASLTMGRDKFRDYAAQRLSRIAVDVLTKGHIDPNSIETGQNQLQEKIQKNQDNFLRACQLPETRDDFGGDPLQLWYANTITPIVNEGVNLFRGNYAGLFMQPKPSDLIDDLKLWWDALQRNSADTRGLEVNIDAFLKDKLRILIVDQLATAILEQTKIAISKYGLEYAAKMVSHISSGADGTSGTITKLINNLENWGKAVMPLTRDFSKMADFVARNQGGGSMFGRSKSVSGLGNQTLQAFQSELDEKLNTYLNIAVCRLLVETLKSLKEGFIKQLLGELGENLKWLNAAKEEAGTIGVEDSSTSVYAQWPEAGKPVPSRFKSAHNEETITEINNFEDDYITQVKVEFSDLGVNESLENLELRMVQSIIQAKWETVGGIAAADDLISIDQEWMPNCLVVRRSGNEYVSDKAKFTVKNKTEDILERALAYLDRPGQAFQRYIATDIKGYLGTGSDLERESRKERIIQKFKRAMDQALPMVAVNENIATSIHGISRIERTLSFSRIPFASSDAGDEINKFMDASADLSEYARGNFKREMEKQGNDEGITRVDIFGSYQNFAPIVYSSIFQPMTDFKSHAEVVFCSRTRSTRAFVPVSNAERKAMIAGWLIGDPLGLIEIPDRKSSFPIKIWDIEGKSWNFPAKLFVNPIDFKHQSFAKYDYLPDVLLSYVLALVDWYRVLGNESLNSSNMDRNPMGAYRALRRIADTSPDKPDQLWSAAKDLLKNYLEQGYIVSGREPKLAAEDTIEDRYQTLFDYWQKMEDFYRNNFATPNEKCQTASTLDHLAKVPLCADLAEDLISICGVLRAVLDKANDELKSGAHTADDFSENFDF